jgi:hypothetical protein
MNRSESMRVISVTKDSQLRRLRDAILTAAGFNVISPATIEEGWKAVTSKTFALLLLCHTLRADESDSLLQLARTAKPAMKVLQLTVAYEPSGSFQPDAQLESLAGPAALIEALCELSGSTQVAYHSGAATCEEKKITLPSL